ncbi:DUF3040 domain-containing protein [Actinokineospora bangkokensis]|uniref:DUF3040 domain-containing protein n=1 Tax=Actinokineospora bangkokensis TaxID=1193682 RepID=UPI001301927B|nr:DUF3040 domain-containing protein [Actinokineospora bangkokensis]
MDPRRLTWHEQRALAEIEQRFRSEDPDMAAAFAEEPVVGALPGPARVALAGVALVASVVGLLASAPLVVFTGMVAAAAVLFVGNPLPAAPASARPQPEDGGLPGALPPV